MAAIFSSPTERMTMYIQADADPLHMLSLSLVAVGFGGAMVNDPQDAMVIIITNRNTALGKSLIANYSVCPTKEVIPVVVVDHKWLDACVQQRRIVSEYTDGGFCGGFYLPREGIVAESSVASFTHLPVTPLTLGDQTNDIGPRKEDDGPPLKTPISEGSANTAVPAKSFPSAMVPSAYLQQNLAFESNSASNHSGNDINLGTSVHQIAEESSSVISVVTDRIAAELADKAEKCRNQWAPYTRKEIMQLIFYLVDHPQEYGELRQNKIKVSFNKTGFWQGLNDITRSKRVPYSWSNYFSRHQAKLVKAIDAQLQLVADETPFDDGNHASEHAAGVPQETSSCEGEAFDFSVNDNVVTGDNENRDGQGCSVSQEVTATRMMGSDSKGDDYEAGGSLYALKPTVATYHHASHHLNDPSRTGMPNQRGRPFDSTEIQALVEYLVDHPEMCHGPQGAATGIRVNREHQWIKFSEGVGQGRSPES
ncbi:hypothetical protein FRB94_006071 [Tulasnella sp. JGI-2019a]|nr:hypothetical protein FRB94_006071 [Tulasnella sp. JGI-2019a]